MITVQVKLYATFRRRYPQLDVGERMPVELSEGATVGRLIERLELPPDQVKVAFVNGVRRGEEFALSDGDEVALFPPVGGG